LRPSAVFRTGSGGARVGRTISGKRQFSLDYTQLFYETYATMEAFHHGHQGPGPFVLHDPGRVNWLTPNQSGATSVYNDTSNFTVAGSGSNLASSSSAYHRGPRSLRWNFTYTASGALTLDTPAADWPGIPVIAGQALAFSFYGEGAGTDAIMSLTPQLVWYDSAGVFVSTSSGSPVATSSSAWVSGSISDTPPATAVYVIPRILVTGQSAGSVLYLDEFQLERGSALSAWRPGTGVYPVQVISFAESWPWQASTYRNNPSFVVQEVGP
jgi:hypothetical protein